MEVPVDLALERLFVGKWPRHFEYPVSEAQLPFDVRAVETSVMNAAVLRNVRLEGPGAVLSRLQAG